MNIQQLFAAGAAGTFSGADLDKGIAWVRSTGSKFDNMVHIIACGIIAHAKEHNDCSRALKLVEAMPRSARRAALIRWFTAYSPIAVTFHNDVKKRRVGLRKTDAKNYNPFDLDGARLNPYYDWDKAEQNALDVLLGLSDVNSKIIDFADRLERNIKNDKVAPADKAAVEAKIVALRSAARA